MRWGYASIRLDMYGIGTRYFIHLKTATMKIELNFRSYFGISRGVQYQRYAKLLEDIWDDTLVRILNEMIAQIEEGKSVAIEKCIVSERGIEYNNFLIGWEDLSYQVNYNRVTINSKSDSSVFTNLYYTDDWNAHVLRYYLDWKLDPKLSQPES
jgi:hypothetical protein